MKTTIQLTPSEYLHGYFKGLFDGTEIRCRNDLQTLALLEYLGNPEGTSDTTVIIAYDTVTLQFTKEAIPWYTVMASFDKAAMTNPDIISLLTSLIEGYFKVHLAVPVAGTPYLQLLDTIIASIVNIAHYVHSNPKLNNLH